ncbi:methylated-DNA--[protein]-cysteine S-methyltransferase [Algiphilus sp.]|uniref:methylated-DNA--[protein]-cysteine S-methyltransferase n=1 Tax=Algiphilus sp. TaxID=1872431 RepID=UPI003B52FE50
MSIRLDTPLGPMLARFDETALTELHFCTEPEARAARAPRQPMERALSDQLAAYFAGDRIAFDLPLAPKGSAFAMAVWQALLRIPYGQTAAYADIATAVGQPKAARAVGRANGANPICILIPCHRVVRSGGAIGGYGGGVERKRALLDIEQSAAASAPVASTAAAAA